MTTAADVPALVTLHVWGVAPRRIPQALHRMARDRRPLKRTRGLTFAKLLGTGHARTFDLRDADLRHWGLLGTWANAGDAERFQAGPTASAWARISEERLHVTMRPLASKGRWSKRAPFGDPRPTPHDGPVAAITRARLSPRKAATFWRAVPPVVADLHASGGLRLALGIGEAPIGLQGTFSLWQDGRALNEFAHGREPHREAVRRTAEEGWYAEELFARFAVLDVEGTFHGRAP